MHNEKRKGTNSGRGVNINVSWKWEIINLGSGEGVQPLDRYTGFNENSQCNRVEYVTTLYLVGSYIV